MIDDEFPTPLGDYFFYMKEFGGWLEQEGLQVFPSPLGDCFFNPVFEISCIY